MTLIYCFRCKSVECCECNDMQFHCSKVITLFCYLLVLLQWIHNKKTKLKGREMDKRRGDRLWGVRETASISNSAETISFRVNESMVWDCNSGPLVVLWLIFCLVEKLCFIIYRISIPLPSCLRVLSNL